MLPAFERDLFTGYSQRNPLYLSTNVAVVHCAKANLSDRVVISNSNYEVNIYKLKDVEFILDMHVGKFNTWVQMSTFSSSDKYLAVLVANEITIYDASLYCKMVLTFCPHNFGCMFIHWSRSISSETDLCLATCGKDGTVKLWTSNTLWNTELSRDMTHPSTADLMLGLVQDPSDLIRDRAHRDMGHKGTVACAAFNSCDSHILSAGVDNKIILWLVENGSKLMVFESHLDVVLSVCWTKDDTRFASVGGDCRVLVWRITQKSPIQWFEGHSDTIESCHFLNGDYLLTVGRDREFFVWDVSSMVELPDSLDVRQKRVIKCCYTTIQLCDTNFNMYACNYLLLCAEY
jgi:WD40 repeat protein